MYNNRHKIDILLLLMIEILIFICIFLFLFSKYKNYQTKRFGYLYDSHYNKQNLLTKYTYSIKYNHDALNSMSCNAHFEEEIIGKLILIPWKIPTIHNLLYIGNNLEVLEKHRGKGIANQIVRKSSNTITSKGGFGLFSTNLELSIPDKIYELYWKKIKPDQMNIPENLVLLKSTYDTVLYDNYPKHPWLDVPILQRRTYLKYLESNGIQFVNLSNKGLTMAIEFITDSDSHKVLYVKWFWGKINDLNQILGSICKLFQSDYIAIPELSVKNTENIWDKSLSYLHFKPSNITIPKLNETDIFGWYLDR